MLNTHEQCSTHLTQLFISMMSFSQNLVNTFSVTVDKQGSEINQLDQDVIILAKDMDKLNEQVLEDVFCFL